MYRALVTAASEGKVELSEEEIHHLIRVRRLQPGQMFLGLGRAGEGVSLPVGARSEPVVGQGGSGSDAAATCTENDAGTEPCQRG